MRDHGFRPDIQGLRALAVSLVVLYHAGVPALAGGFVGVDVFFVISGYLITKQLISEHDARGHIDFAAFYARRIRRLLPAAAVMALVTTGATLALLSPLEQRNLTATFLASALYLSNLWFASQATDYLAGSTHQNLMLHTWSLSVEEQFYLAWPLLIALLVRTGITNRRPRWNLALGAAILLLVSFSASILIGKTSQPWAFFASPLRAWEFAAGAIVLAAERANLHLNPQAAVGSLLSGLALIGGSAFIFDHSTPFPDWRAAVPVTGTALVLLGGHTQGWFQRACTTPTVRWLGETSYSLYLWHWPILTLPALLYGELSPLARALCVVFSLLCGAASYVCLERHFRFHPFFSGSTTRSLLLGGALTTLVAASSVGVWAIAKEQLGSPKQRSILAAKGDLPQTYVDGCHLKYDEILFGPCVYGSSNAERTIMLFGDSHAAQWFPVLNDLALQQGYRLVSLTKSGCPSAKITPWSDTFQRPYVECEEWQEKVLERIRVERPALVVIANSSRYVAAGRPSSPDDAWFEGLSTTLKQLATTGSSVLIIRDTPWFPVDVPTCLSRAEWVGADLHICDFPRDQVLSEHIFMLERAVAARYPAVSLVDTSDLLCSSASCFAKLNENIAYRDAHHLTELAVRTMTSLIGDAVRRALPVSDG